MKENKQKSTTPTKKQFTQDEFNNYVDSIDTRGLVQLVDKFCDNIEGMEDIPRWSGFFNSDIESLSVNQITIIKVARVITAALKYEGVFNKFPDRVISRTDRRKYVKEVNKKDK